MGLGSMEEAQSSGVGIGWQLPVEMRDIGGVLNTTILSGEPPPEPSDPDVEATDKRGEQSKQTSGFNYKVK